MRHQGWLHLFEELVPSVFEKEVRELIYTIKFEEYGWSLFALVQRKKVELDEETLGKILDILIIEVRYLKNQQPLVVFMRYDSKVGWTSIIGVRKKFLNSEFRLVYEFVNKVVLPRSEKEVVASTVDLFMMEF